MNFMYFVTQHSQIRFSYLLYNEYNKCAYGPNALSICPDKIFFVPDKIIFVPDKITFVPDKKFCPELKKYIFAYEMDGK